ncbi:hypothetical protein M404DRAFT_1002373, partial [Pisolithus tinctorius Marx 270]
MPGSQLRPWIITILIETDNPTDHFRRTLRAYSKYLLISTDCRGTFINGENVLRSLREC